MIISFVTAFTVMISINIPVTVILMLSSIPAVIWEGRFNKKSVILISHRLSSTRMADKIYVLDNGSIVEEGSHDELMSMNGIYARMFKVQSEKYAESV